MLVQLSDINAVDISSAADCSKAHITSISSVKMSDWPVSVHMKVHILGEKNMGWRKQCRVDIPFRKQQNTPTSTFIKICLAIVKMFHMDSQTQNTVTGGDAFSQLVTVNTPGMHRGCF
jgi:hypothetical protein